MTKNEPKKVSKNLWITPALAQEFQDFVDAVKQVSGFWAVVNEVPDSLNRSEDSDAPLASATVKT